MDLDAVRVFVDVIRMGSFAAVARQRDVDPSSVSRSISGLESELGFRLFQRTTRKLAPTEAGDAYYSQVNQLVSAFESAGEQALDLVREPTGKLRVTACTSFGQRILAPLLPKLRTRYPELTIELLLVDHHVDIVEQQIDIAIRFGSKPKGEFTARELVPRKFSVCASPAYIESHDIPQQPKDLAALDCLLFPMQGYKSVWRFRTPAKKIIDVPVRGRLLVSHGMTMTACAVAGLGPALLPDWLCKEEIESGTLVDLFPGYECTATEFKTAAWLVYQDRGYLPLKLKAFIDFLYEEVTGFA